MSASSWFARGNGTFGASFIPEIVDRIVQFFRASGELKGEKGDTGENGRSIIFFPSGSFSTLNAVRYIYFGVSVNTEGLENDVAVPIDYPMKIRRFRYLIGSNSKNNVTNIAFRSNNASVPESVVSIPAGQNTSFDSGPIDINLAIGSKICWRLDTSLCTTGQVSVILHTTLEVVGG